MAPAKSKLPCMACKHGTRRAGGQKCEECWLRGQPIDVRQRAATARLLAVPPDLRAERVPKDSWPVGRRWCAGCQTFVLLKDCGPSASRCRTCVSGAQHAAMVERTYEILDPQTGQRRPFTADDYDRLYRLQKGLCAACGQPSRSKRLAVDHDHKTGLARGLLCPGDEWGCNRTIMAKIDKDKDPLAMIERIRMYYVNPPAGRI